MENKPSYFLWAMKAKTSLTLLKGKQRDWLKGMSQEDINKYILSEYIRHFGNP